MKLVILLSVLVSLVGSLAIPAPFVGEIGGGCNPFAPRTVEPCPVEGRPIAVGLVEPRPVDSRAVQVRQQIIPDAWIITIKAGYVSRNFAPSFLASRCGLSANVLLTRRTKLSTTISMKTRSTILSGSNSSIRCIGL
jgi:hypothetical protein